MKNALSGFMDRPKDFRFLALKPMVETSSFSQENNLLHDKHGFIFPEQKQTFHIHR